jgi:uncharacterized protein YutE (UPF0331/DUF86 family)
VVERDVALAKIALIDQTLRRIAEIGERTELSRIDAEELTVLNLQRGTQAAIDLAAHVIASEGWGLPDTLGENFTILAQRGVIAPDLAENLRRMTGFRNVAVHNYEQVNQSIVDDIVRNHLGDLRLLCRKITEAFGADW